LTGNDVMLRSLMAQLEERDGRIALLERHAMEEVQRADSMIRGYDERVLQMTEELMKLRSEHSTAQREIAAMRGSDGTADPHDTDPLGLPTSALEGEVLKNTLE